MKSIKTIFVLPGGVLKETKFNKAQFSSIDEVRQKKPDCINHALGTMPIGKPLAHRETQLLSSIVLQFFLT